MAFEDAFYNGNGKPNALAYATTPGWAAMIGHALKSGVRPVKQSREMLKADLNTLRTNPNALGLSDSEKEKMRSEAVQTASAQNQAQASQLSQSALAGQGFQQGAFESAQQGLGQDASDAAVKAGTSINDLHNRMVEAEKARIYGALDADRERVRENTRFWLDKGIQGVGAIISAAMGGGLSPLAGLGAAAGGAAAPAAAAAAPAAAAAA